MNLQRLSYDILKCRDVEYFFKQSPKSTLGFAYLGASAKLLTAAVSFGMSVCPSVRPHGTTRLPLDGFSLNLIFECFSKIYREKSSFVKI
jgi:hypothetical protein